MSGLETPITVIRDTNRLDSDIQERTIQYLKHWDEWKYGLSPHTAAAGAYYAAGLVLSVEGARDDVPTQERVAELFGTTEMSVREHYQSIIVAGGEGQYLEEL